MRTFILPVAFVVTACTEKVDCEYKGSDGKSAFVVYDVTHEQCNEIIENAAHNKPQTYEFGDDQTEDTDTESATCEFTVQTVDGETVLPNSVTAYPDQQGPHGRAEPGVIETLAFGITTDDRDCPSLPLVGFEIWGQYSDRADTGWRPTDVILSESVTGTTYEGVATYTNVLKIEYTFEDAMLDPYMFFSITADVSGASAEADDQVAFDLWPNSIRVRNTDGEVITLQHENVAGGSTLYF